MFKVTLAKDIDFDTLKLPVLVSPKLDGIRCTIQGGVAYARSLKPIRQPKLQELVQQAGSALDGLDGELVTGPPAEEGCWNRTSSCIMSKDPAKWDDETRLWVFDSFSNSSLAGLEDRLDNARSQLPTQSAHSAIGRPHWLRFVEQTLVETTEGVVALYEEFIAQGYEGIVTRDPYLPYQQRRSSAKVQALMRLKPVADHEGRVLALIEKMHNTNEATTNELGRTARSSAKEGLVPAGTLGAMIVEDMESGQKVRIGSFKGLTDPMKKAIFDKHDCIGKLVKFKSMDYGAKDAPRHGVFLGFRDEDDL